jgi:hypothetical protein
MFDQPNQREVARSVFHGLASLPWSFPGAPTFAFIMITVTIRNTARAVANAAGIGPAWVGAELARHAP